ncbi:threonine dehydratase [Nocardia sp. GP40]|uniref:pyridoxal-phosphate dependent enzyme n=1 Tax=Nocardia sp. GP40 TaxID=3156268 RepID=UPI003D19875F
MGVEEISWHPDIVNAWHNIAGDIAPLCSTELNTAALPSTIGARVVLAHEEHQHAGSFRARGALSYLRAMRKAGALPREGIAVAADCVPMAAAWAWAAKTARTPAMLVASPVPAAALRPMCGDGVTVKVVTDGDPGAWRDAYARAVRALVPDPDDPLIAAAAGTWVRDIYRLTPSLSTVIIAGGTDGLLLGTVATAHHHGLKTVLVTSQEEPIPLAAQQVLADERRFPGMASDGRGVRLESVKVAAADVAAAARMLRRRGLVVNEEAAMALAALMTPVQEPGRCYRPQSHESIAVLLSGPPSPSPSATPHALTGAA